MAKKITLSSDYGYNQYKLSGSDADIIDASRASWIQANSGSRTNTYPFYIQNGKPGLEIKGGDINGKFSLSKDWGSMYAEGNSAGVFVKNTPNVIIRDWEIDRTWDGIRLRSSDNFLIENVRISNIRDDAIENDDGLSGTIRNSLFDGAFVGLSLGDANTDSSAKNEVVTLDNVYMRMENFMYRPKGYDQPIMTHHSPFKMSANSPQLKIYDTVIAIENVDHPGQARMDIAWDRMVDGHGNVFLNLSNEPLPADYPLPAFGWTVLQGQEARDYWEDSVAAYNGDVVDDTVQDTPPPSGQSTPPQKIDIEGDGEANTLIGTKQDDVIFAHGNKDILNGKQGNDTLDGGGGADIFEFDTPLATTGVDTILDFKVGVDKIHLDVNVYKALGDVTFGDTKTLAAKFYRTAARAEDGNDKIIYKWRTGELFYDADSKGGEAAVKIAQLEAKLDISHSDFVLYNSEEPPAEKVLMEFGSIEANHHMTEVHLEHTFINPVILMTMTTTNGPQVSVPRITDIDSASFSFYIQEPTYLDGSHNFESFSYIVVEAGSWVLSDGTKIEAGNIQTNTLSKHGFKDVSFATNFDSSPAVFSQVQSNNDKAFVDTRHDGSSADGFRVSLQEEELYNTGKHGTEDIGWLAIEQGAGHDDGFDFIAGSTGNNVTDALSSIVFDNAIDELPQLLAQISTEDGPDSAFLRVQDLDKNGARMHIQEDQSQDTETRHTSEAVDFFAIEGAGQLTGLHNDDVVY